MEPTQQISLARGCSNCISAKRKCSRSFPKCQRCEKRNVSCRYTNGSSLCLGGDLISSKAVQPARMTSDQKNFQRIIRISDDDKFQGKGWSNKDNFTPINVVPDALPFTVRMEAKTVNYIIQHLRPMPTEFSQTRGTTFIHSQLYTKGLPRRLQQISSLCYMQSHFLSTDYTIIAKTFTVVSGSILESSTSIHSFLSVLEFVQALILLQIMALFCFSEDQPFQTQAQRCMLLLKSWTEKLYHEVPSTLPSTMTPYQAWITAESVRRTIHTSHLLQEVFSMCTQGHWQLTIFVKALPVNMASMLWDYDPPQCKEAENAAIAQATVPEALLYTDLISYRELTDKWNNGEIVPTQFEKLLLIACRGMRVVINSN